ncbi:MAG TPA: DUF1697 domain-containing protein, partial [Kofleriaceae bacterium]|nr:DUF1697 domain-containing protein [Kofleriaceae bacterium]
MTQYAAFLRGINVGGIKVPMAALRACLDGAGYPGAKTFLQTGNLLLESSRSATALEAHLAKVIGEAFAYKAFVQVVTAKALAKIIASCPYDDGDDGRHAYVVFVGDGDIRRELLAANSDLDPAVDEIAPGPGVVYWQVPKGQTTKSAFGKLLSKKRFQAQTTTRNL